MGVSCLSVSSRCDAATDHGDLCVWSCEVWPAPATSLCPSSLPPLQPSPPGHNTGASKETCTTHVAKQKHSILHRGNVLFCFLLSFILLCPLHYTKWAHTHQKGVIPQLFTKCLVVILEAVEHIVYNNKRDIFQQSYLQYKARHKGRERVYTAHRLAQLIQHSHICSYTIFAF